MDGAIPFIRKQAGEHANQAGAASPPQHPLPCAMGAITVNGRWGANCGNTSCCHPCSCGRTSTGPQALSAGVVSACECSWVSTKRALQRGQQEALLRQT